MSEAAQRRKKAARGCRETEARQCAKVRHLIRTIRGSRKPSCNANKELELPNGSCSALYAEGRSGTGKPAANPTNIVEGHESTRERERTLPKDHEGHIAWKGYNSLSLYVTNCQHLSVVLVLCVSSAHVVRLFFSLRCSHDVTFFGIFPSIRGCLSQGP